MQIIQLPENFIQIINENEGLDLYLENLVKGKPFTERSWLYEQEEPEDILSRWLEKLASLKSGSPYEREVFQFDTSQLEKWGPQGGVAPIADIMDIVTSGFSQADSPQPKAFSTQEWRQAIDTTERQLWQMGCYALRPASYERVVDDMRARDTLVSNSGWPDFTRRSLPEVKARAIEAARDGQWKNYPAIALFRNYNKKTRLVWMFPMSANIVEGSYFQPLQSRIMQGTASAFSAEEGVNLEGNPWGFFAPWRGFDQVKQNITRIYRQDWSHRDSVGYLSASDFSETDAHFTLHATNQVAEVLERCFQKQFSNGLRESLQHMQTIPLIIGPDSMIIGEHGVSSGSNWTNFIETIFDLILANYVYIVTGERFDGFYAIGDDMTWVTDNFSDAFEDQLEQIGKDVGQVIKADKTTNYRDKVKSLQRLFQRGYNTPEGWTRGVYSTIRALKSSIYPEKMHKKKLWNSNMFCARQFMILENCVDHPLFEEFVSFVVHGQKDLIPFSRKSRKELDRILRETKLLPGFNPTYNQEKRDSSLADFRSIEIARKL